MGLIKTAMMSGAAMYGVKQLAKTAQSRKSDSPPRGRDYSDREYDSYRPVSRPPEFRDRNNSPEQPQRYVDTQHMQSHDRMYDDEPSRQRLYLEPSQRPAAADRGQPYYMQTPSYDDNFPQYEYVSSNMRRPSTGPPQYYRGEHRQQQGGFVEAEEVRDSDPQGPQSGGGNRAEMLNMLAQQAMSMGLVGGGGKKEKNGSKGDLVSSFFSK